MLPRVQVSFHVQASLDAHILADVPGEGQVCRFSPSLSLSLTHILSLCPPPPYPFLSFSLSPSHAILTLGAFFSRGGPVQDPVLTQHQVEC